MFYTSEMLYYLMKFSIHLKNPYFVNNSESDISLNYMNTTLNKIGFDNEKYLKEQTVAILERVDQFNGRLYLEFGGKTIAADQVHGSFMAALGSVYARVLSLSDYKGMGGG